MPFITQGKTNIKYLLILVILAAIVGGGILWLANNQEVFLQSPWIKSPEKTGCDWRPNQAKYGQCEKMLGYYYDGEKCQPLSGCSLQGDKISFLSIEECRDQCEKNETADWKVYQSQVGDFLLKYPKEWFTDQKYSTENSSLLVQESTGAISSNKDFLQAQDDAFVIVFNNYEKLDYITLDDFILTYKTAESGEFFYPDIIKEGRKEIKIGSKDAVWLEGNLGPAVKHIEIFILKDETQVIVIEGWDTGSQPVQEKYVDLLNQILSTFQFIEPMEKFCGWSTNGSCGDDSDCMIGGCSGQVCQSKGKEVVGTTCEFRECYSAENYGLECKCVDNQCQWAK